MMSNTGAANKTNNLDATKRNGNGNVNNNNGLYAKPKVTNAGSMPSTSSGNGNNNNNIKDSDESCVDSNSLKHPVGLEAIKEMTRNKHPENQT